MLNTVLVPLDGSRLAECVLPHAVAIAKAFDARAILLNILEQPSESLRMPKADPLDWYLKKTEADTYLSVVKTRLEECDLAVEKRLIEGRAAEQIVELAHTNIADLLILSSHDGSIIQQILQRIRTSTLIIRTNQPNTAQISDLRYRRLLVPLDGSRRAGATLTLATALAQAHQAELLLVHVVKKPEMARHMPLTVEDEELMNRFVERNQEEGTNYLEYLQAHLPTNVQTHLLVSDNVAATIQSFSEQERIDLLVLGAHGYSGEAKWSYGGVTNRFITNGTIPLLIVQDSPYESSDEMAREDVTVRRLAR
jgi:nucleotide-binding universal stress UspA family protein